MADGGPAWELERFTEMLEIWATHESASIDLRLVVTAWLFTRLDDPYQGVERETGFENLWYGVVPGSAMDDGTVVTCSYWIEERRHALRCNAFATLHWPA